MVRLRSCEFAFNDALAVIKSAKCDYRPLHKRLLKSDHKKKYILDWFVVSLEVI
jgi:hypothetical protein